MTAPAAHRNAPEGSDHAGIPKNPEGGSRCDECATPATWSVTCDDGLAYACDRHRAEDDSECDALGLARTPWEPIRADSRHAGAVVGLVILVLAALLCPGCGSREGGDVPLWVGAAVGGVVVSLVGAWVGDAVRRAVRE